MKTRDNKPPLHSESTHRVDQPLSGKPFTLDSSVESIRQSLNDLQTKEVEQEVQKSEFTRIREELMETRNKYSVLYDFAPAGYITLDNQGIILDANLTLSELLGFEKSNLIGSKFTQYLIPSAREAFTNHLKDSMSTGTRKKCEVRMRKKDGNTFHARIESIAIRDSKGNLSQCHTTVIDVTDHHRFEELNSYQNLVAAVSCDAIIATDKDLNITQWNRAAETMFGWTADEVLGPRTVLQIRTKILEPLTNQDVLKAVAENGSWMGEITVNRKDGTKLNTLVSIGVIWDSNGNFNGIVAIHHETKPSEEVTPAPVSDDIEAIVKKRTEELVKANRILQQELGVHKQTVLAAKESEGRNRDLVDNIKLGIFRCTPGRLGKFLEVNKAMEEITGYSREELLQIDVYRLYTPIDESTPFNNEVNITDWKVTRELILKRKDKKELTVAVTVVAIRFDSGTTQYFDGILEDITERKIAQQQIQNSLQRLQKTIKEIIQAMAYIGEVRDPYTAGHQRRVAQLSLEISKLIGLQDDQYEGLTMAAFVHDIGKILVPADILSKPGKLTRPELDMLKDHTRIGYEILKNIEFPWPIAKIVLQHHERMNGSGYPSGLQGNDIIIEARILAVADVVEAMSSHRPYRPALGIDKALDEININRGTLYDSNVVDACIKLFIEKGFNLN